MFNKVKDWITITYDKEDEPLIKYDVVMDEMVNIATGEVIE